MHHHHDLIYPLLSSALAVFGAWTALDLFSRARRYGGQIQIRWIALSAVAMGVSIWSMHFIAMLGFDPGTPVSFTLVPTVASLILAIAGTAGAFAICASPRSPSARLVVGGLCMGLSIGGMHYLGMAALKTTSMVGYRPAWVFPSVGVALVASTLALAATRKDGRLLWRMGAGLVLGAGIVAMHYTAMSAVVLTPGTTMAEPTAIPSLWLAFAVAGMTLFLLFLALGVSLLDQKQVLLAALRAGRLGYWDMDVPRRRLTLSEYGQRLVGFEPGDEFDQSLVAERLTPESAEHRDNGRRPGLHRADPGPVRAGRCSRFGDRLLGHTRHDTAQKVDRRYGRHGSRQLQRRHPVH